MPDRVREPDGLCLVTRMACWRQPPRKGVMNGIPMIERIQLTRYRFPFDNVGYDLSFAMGAFYDPGHKGARSALGIRIHTDEGVTGEYVSIAPATFEQINMFAPFLIGKNALERERFYNQAKVILRKNDRMGIGPVDIALWDLAGKFASRARLPASGRVS